MLIVRAPFRISFFGGGTDFEDYFKNSSGAVISTTIDRYCYTTLRHLPELFEYKNQLTYSKIERFDTPSQLEHPLVREMLKFLPVDRIQISYDADLPACSGIGSSSAFAVSLLEGLHTIRNEHVDKMTLAKEAIYVERNLCQEAGGVQDQIAVAFGGLNRIDFCADGYTIEKIEIDDCTKYKLQNNLLLLFTGFTRFAGAISKTQQKNIPLSIPYLDKMKELTDEAQKLLIKGDTDGFGKLLNVAWDLKKHLSEQISNPDIDEIYNEAKKNGALGGKLLGAGSGGFMLLYVPKEKQTGLKREMNKFKFISFGFENEGTKIIYDDKKY